MAKVVVLNDKKFISLKKFEEYVKNIIYDKIGLCSDIKLQSEYYDDLIEILKRHPEFEEKTKNMKTLKIERDSCNKKAFKIIIINDDNTTDDISWRCAISGKGASTKHELMSAMRNSIVEQILDFKKNNDNVCDMCESRDVVHIDHIIHFDIIAENFINKMKLKSIKIPDKFDDDKNTHRRTFLANDNYFELKWKKYHQRKSKLRILCDKCNLSRSKK